MSQDNTDSPPPEYHEAFTPEQGGFNRPVMPLPSSGLGLGPSGGQGMDIGPDSTSETQNFKVHDPHRALLSSIPTAPPPPASMVPPMCPPMHAGYPAYGPGPVYTWHPQMPCHAPPSSTLGAYYCPPAPRSSLSAYDTRPIVSHDGTSAPQGEPQNKKRQKMDPSTGSVITPPKDVSMGNVDSMPSGPGIPGPHSDSCKYGDLIRVEWKLPLPDDPPIHLDTRDPQPRPDTYEDVLPYISMTDSDSDSNEKKRGKKKVVQPKRKKVTQAMPSHYVRPDKTQGRMGRIPDVFGRWKPPGADYITWRRSNRMGGMLSSYLYWSPLSNIVFAGEMAMLVSKLEFKATKPFKVDPKKNQVYKTAMEGIPVHPKEVIDLLAFVHDPRNPIDQRAEGFLLLSELYYIARRIDESNLENCMVYLLRQTNFDPANRPAGLTTILDGYRLIQPRCDIESARISNALNNTDGMGMTQPTGATLYDSDRLGRFMVTNRNPGREHIHGVAFDFRRAIDRRSLHGYTICRFFAPEVYTKGGKNNDATSSRNAYLLFTRLLAIMISTPTLYREYIGQWNERHPDRVFVAQMSIVRYYRRMRLLPGGNANLTMDIVAEVLIHNGVDPAEIDHAYPFGVRYLNDVYTDDPIHRALFDAHDNSRLEYLYRKGIPSAIEGRDGWILPTDKDLIRLHHIETKHLYDRTDKGRQPILDFSPRWLKVGAPLSPLVLDNRFYATSVRYFWECRDPEKFLATPERAVPPPASDNPQKSAPSTPFGLGGSTRSTSLAPLDPSTNMESTLIVDWTLSIDVTINNAALDNSEPDVPSFFAASSLPALSDQTPSSPLTESQSIPDPTPRTENPEIPSA